MLIYFVCQLENPMKSKDFNHIYRLKKWLAVLTQYKFVRKHHATAHIEEKAIEVTLHGNAWKVYPMKCRNKTLYRVVHRVNGERRPENFSSLADAKADAQEYHQGNLRPR